MVRGMFDRKYHSAVLDKVKLIDRGTKGIMMMEVSQVIASKGMDKEEVREEYERRVRY